MTIKQKNGSVPDTIAMIIRAQGMKKCFVAERAGLSEAAFCDMLNGRRVITARDIANLAAALNTTPDELFR